MRTIASLLVMALFLSPVLAVDWEDIGYQVFCDDFREPTNFIVYGNVSRFYTQGNYYELIVNPRVSGSLFVSEYSQLMVASNPVPLIPAFDYPSAYSTFSYLQNRSFLVPGTDISAGVSFDLRLVANSSAGTLLCSERAWEAPDGIEDTTRPKLSGDNLFSVNVTFMPVIQKFNFDLANYMEADHLKFYLVVYDTVLNEVAEVQVYELVEGEVHPITSRQEYASPDVAKGTYAVYVFTESLGVPIRGEMTPFSSIFYFKDFDLDYSLLPGIMPGRTYTTTLTLTNVGTLPDSYTFNLKAPENWVYSVGSVATLDAGESRDFQLSFTVPELHIGPAVINFNITGSTFTRSYELQLRPETETYLEISLPTLLDISAYSTNLLNLTLAGAGTIEPLIYWTVYTNPALLMYGGEGSGLVEIGKINRFVSQFDLSGACALSAGSSEALNAARRVLLYSRVAYDMMSDLSQLESDHLSAILSRVNAEKLKMTDPGATNLFSRTERLVTLLDNVRDAYEVNASLSRKRSLKENLYLFTIDFGTEIRDVGERMAKTCTAVEDVVFNVFLFSEDTMQDWLKSREVEVIGPTVVELIGPQEVKVVSGGSTTLQYTIKNSAGEDFEVEMEASVDYLSVPSFFFLESGASRKLDFRFRPSRTYTANGEKVYVEVVTRSYTINFPLTVYAGPFDPDLRVTDLAVIPGQEAAETFTITTGGLDDIFDLTSDCPSWVSLPASIATNNSEGPFTVLAAPGSDVREGSYSCELILVPRSFPEFVTRENLYFSVSREALQLVQTMAQYQSWYDEVINKFDRSTQIQLETYFSQARREINNGEYTGATLTLRRINNLLSSTNAEEGQGKSPLLILLLVVLVGALGFVLYKYVLVKPKPKVKAPDGEEVI